MGPVLGEALGDQGEELGPQVRLDIHGVRGIPPDHLSFSPPFSPLPLLHCLLLKLEVVVVLAPLEGVLIERLGLVEEVPVGAEGRQPFVHCWSDVLQHIWRMV